MTNDFAFDKFRHPYKINSIDLYIAKAEPFAQPILHHIRELVHIACPNIEESLKWGFPNFSYKGIVCNMASFKQHCSFGFWKAALITDPHKLFFANLQYHIWI